jgi:hypothetical protein
LVDIAANHQGSRYDPFGPLIDYHQAIAEQLVKLGEVGMSFLLAAPEALATAASDLAGVGSTISTASSVAAAPTTGLLAAAADEVSTQVAMLFSEHAQGYQRLSAQVAAFHERFVQSLTAGAGAYAAAEANAVQTLVNAVNGPAVTVLGHPLIGSGLSKAVGRLGSIVLGNGGAGLIGSGGSGVFGGRGAAAVAGALHLQPTGGAGGLAAASALLRPVGMTNAAAVPAALAGASIANTIENIYTFVEPYVQYGFQLLAYVVGFVPWIGILAPQINFLYNLFEPIVQSALFNTLDWLSGTISFSTGLSNLWSATTSSINYFIQTEINWVLSFFPPLPPLPPFL